jgi:hypothetical protein
MRAPAIQRSVGTAGMRRNSTSFGSRATHLLQVRLEIEAVRAAVPEELDDLDLVAALDRLRLGERLVGGVLALRECGAGGQREGEADRAQPFLQVHDFS